MDVVFDRVSSVAASCCLPRDELRGKASVVSGAHEASNPTLSTSLSLQIYHDSNAI
jgi:hypothetical protein